MKNELELRMYGLVPYNISPIQQAIQYGHAVVEYGLNYFNDTDYQNWARNHKTFIILNGGTSNHGPTDHNICAFGYTGDYGSMEKHNILLNQNNIKHSVFNEPDLNFMTSAIVFLVDERVFNKEKYPNFEDWLMLNYSNLISQSLIDLNKYEIANSIKNSTSKKDQKVYQEWVDFLGGEKNVFLRDFLKNFKLA